MATPSLNPSHLLISRNPRSPAHPQLNSATTTTTTLPYAPQGPQPGPHLFGVGAGASTAANAHANVGVNSAANLNTNTNSNSNENVGSYTSCSSLGHMRSHSTPAPSGAVAGGNSGGAFHAASLPSYGSEDEVVDIHPTFCRDAALPGRVKVVVGRYAHEFYCHKEVLWYASPFFNAVLQGGWAETATEGRAKSSPTDTDSQPAPALSPPTIPARVDSGSSSTEPLAAAQAAEAEAHAQAAAATATADPGAASGLPSLYPSTPTPLSPASHSPRGRAARRSRQSIASPGPGPDEDEYNPNKASVYLDAVEAFEDGPGPSVADILRDLRELPEPSGAALDALTSGREEPLPLLAPFSMLTTWPQQPDAALLTFPLAPAPAAAAASAPPERPRSAGAPIPHRLYGAGSASPATVTPTSARRESRDGAVVFDSAVAAWPGRTAASPAAAGGREENIEALITLPEDSASAFQDFLFWAYPHLECKVTWTNVERLIALSSKLMVPQLQTLCERFLRTYASGRPFLALALAELYHNHELYREASRYVLDQQEWDPAEIEWLSHETTVKLLSRRLWFVERLNKLGNIEPEREYVCREECPDPQKCASLLQDKWRQSKATISNFGKPQPSVAFRCLRQLENFHTSRSLVMSTPLCQAAAKSWVATLFDRMFQLKHLPAMPGTEKYWLFITLTSNEDKGK